MYGWDSYFIGLGLLHDGLIDLARDMLTHQVYQIRHYGQVLNANRSYYLTRSQPPFLTRFLKAILDCGPMPLDWVQQVLRTAMHEYDHVWVGGPRLTPTGLSRYLGQGIGMPPETEPGHYDAILSPYAEAAGLPLREFEQAYLQRQLDCPELDAYFVHDRTVREQATTPAIDWRAGPPICAPWIAKLSLLYAYEVDLAELLDRYGEQAGFPKAEVWRAGRPASPTDFRLVLGRSRPASFLTTILCSGSAPAITAPPAVAAVGRPGHPSSGRAGGGRIHFGKGRSGGQQPGLARSAGTHPTPSPVGLPLRLGTPSDDGLGGADSLRPGRGRRASAGCA